MSTWLPYDEHQQFDLFLHVVRAKWMAYDRHIIMEEKTTPAQNKNTIVRGH